MSQSKRRPLSHRYMILTELPTYMVTILGFDIASNAVLSAVPFLVMWIYSIILGSLLDHLISKGVITRTTSTKIATSIGESAGDGGRER